MLTLRAARAGLGNVTGQDFTGSLPGDAEWVLQRLVDSGWMRLPDTVAVADALVARSEDPAQIPVPTLLPTAPRPFSFGKVSRARLSGWAQKVVGDRKLRKKKAGAAPRLLALYTAAHIRPDGRLGGAEDDGLDLAEAADSAECHREESRTAPRTPARGGLAHRGRDRPGQRTGSADSSRPGCCHWERCSENRARTAPNPATPRPTAAPRLVPRLVRRGAERAYLRQQLRVVLSVGLDRRAHRVQGGAQRSGWTAAGKAREAKCGCEIRPRGRSGVGVHHLQHTHRVRRLRCGRNQRPNCGISDGGAVPRPTPDCGCGGGGTSFPRYLPSPCRAGPATGEGWGGSGSSGVSDPSAGIHLHPGCAGEARVLRGRSGGTAPRSRSAAQGRADRSEGFPPSKCCMERWGQRAPSSAAVSASATQGTFVRPAVSQARRAASSAAPASRVPAVAAPSVCTRSGSKRSRLQVWTPSAPAASLGSRPPHCHASRCNRRSSAVDPPPRGPGVRPRRVPRGWGAGEPTRVLVVARGTAGGLTDHAVRSGQGRQAELQGSLSTCGSS